MKNTKTKNVKKFPNHFKYVPHHTVISGGERGHNRAARRKMTAFDRKVPKVPLYASPEAVIRRETLKKKLEYKRTVPAKVRRAKRAANRIKQRKNIKPKAYKK